MKVVALISGGKDSCFNMMQCVAEGHAIVALANLKPKDKDELDSYMYQTVGHQAIDLYAEAMNLPLFRRVIEGGSVNQAKDYDVTIDDEVEDLYQLLKTVKEKLDIEAVSSGAILSDYQRVRVEHVCCRLGLTSLAYLWRREQADLLNEMIHCDVDAMIIKVAALGLTPEKHLGKTLSGIQPHMLAMEAKYGLNPCGEGGEYETFTRDCPLFLKAIVIDEQEVVTHSQDPFAPVAYINFKNMHLEQKPPRVPENQTDRIKHLKMKRSSQVNTEIFPDDVTPVTQDLTSHMDEKCFECTTNRLENATVLHRKSVNGWFYCSGIVGTVEDGSDVEEQTRVAMQRLTGLLSQEQLSVSHLVAVHVYVRNMADFARVNSVYKTYFGINPPIRICVEADLPSNVTLQLDATAHCRADDVKRTMHVQSVSHWAPSNIGPYSQCVQVDDEKVFVAGQIPLVPGTMAIIEGGMRHQARLALCHADRILRAMQKSKESALNLSSAYLVICYVTKPSYIPVAQEEWSSYRSKICETENESSESRACLVEYVVISALPRASLIEWQVLALPSHCDVISEHTLTVRGDSTTATSTGRLYQLRDSNNNTLAFHCKSELQPDLLSTQPLPVSVVHYSLHTAIRGLVTCIQSLSNQHEVAPSGDEETTSLIGGLRIFYSIRYIDINILQNEYLSAWKSVVGQSSLPPVAAFVPVRMFSDQTQILSICHS